MDDIDADDELTPNFYVPNFVRPFPIEEDMNIAEVKFQAIKFNLGSTLVNSRNGS